MECYTALMGKQSICRV